VNFREAAEKWFAVRRGSQRITGRTLYGYRFYLNKHLIPFFGDKVFSQLKASVFESYIAWARKGCRKEEMTITNTSINKAFVPLKMICNHTAIEHGWMYYNPFFGFKKLPEGNPVEKILPITIEEQSEIEKALPDHWKPYFVFAFRSGLRPGEQIAVKPNDIDWENRILHVRRAMTLDEDGKRIEGNTKNRYSRRSIKLTDSMFEALRDQMAIYERFQTEYFFCTPLGTDIHLSNLTRNVWIPALRKAGLKVRELKQTRHSFATNALAYGENPLWVAKVMGHRDTDMIIKVYTRYVENLRSVEDGKAMSEVYRKLQRKEDET
jgi:integrase